MITLIDKIQFPRFSGIRCLMMPYIQGDSSSLPEKYLNYRYLVDRVYLKRGDIGFLTIDESYTTKGVPHRGKRAKTNRALHTEAGRSSDKVYGWGNGGGWGSSHRVTLDRNTEILLANNLTDTCAVWDSEHENTSLDGDIGHESDLYPLSEATLLKAGEVYRIGILTPHESLPCPFDTQRQFLRIVSSGVHGREPYFTLNPLLGDVHV